jgi:hypothetical protein
MEMKKKILICIAFVSIGYIANAQQLTINETVKYINQSIGNKDNFSLSSDGYITYSKYMGEKVYGGSMQEYDYTMINYYKVHISDIRKPYTTLAPWGSIDNRTSKWVAPFSCRGNYCIEFWTSLYKNQVSSKSYSSSFDVSSDGDKYSTGKLLNALQYLYALAEENGMFEGVEG